MVTSVLENNRQTAKILAESAEPIITDYIRIKRKMLRREVSVDEALALASELTPRFVDLILEDVTAFDGSLREYVCIEVEQLILNGLKKGS